MSKEIIGLIEKITVINPINNKRAVLYGLIDTGATSSSLDLRVAAKLNLALSSPKKIKAKTFIVDKIVRPTVKAIVVIKNKEIVLDTITIADRENLSIPMIIGRDVLFNNFIVDVSLVHHSEKVKDTKKKMDLKKVEYYE